MPRAEEGGVIIKSFGYSGALVSRASIHYRSINILISFHQGPTNWHSLNTTMYHECATGKNQSPIDLVSGVYTEVSGSQLSLNIPDFEAGAVFENLGTTVEVVGESGSLVLPSSNKTFNFAQFHFHLPSEHLDNGTSMAMEMHMVFQAADSEIAVLGTYIDITSGTAAAAKRQTGKHAAAAACDGSGSVNTSVNAIVDGGASTMLETLFSSVGEIATPGTATHTSALVMSDIVSMLSTTTFKR